MGTVGTSGKKIITVVSLYVKYELGKRRPRQV
jgi:hypothetical protein